LRKKASKNLSGRGLSILRNNVNQKCRFSIKSAGVLKWVFENIRKRSKTFKNIQKVRRNIRKLSENIQIFCRYLRI